MSLKEKLTDLSPTQRALDAMPLPTGEHFSGETLVADGWVYKDLPRLAPHLFDDFVKAVGEENIRWLTLANYGTSKRGQLFISPAGMARLVEFLRTQTQ